MSETPSREKSVEEQRVADNIEKILYNAKNLRELHALVTQFIQYAEDSAAHERAAELKRELDKITVFMYGIEGQPVIPGDPQDLNEAYAQFPNTGFGELSEAYGIRARVGEILADEIKTRARLDGVDVRL